MEPEEQRNRRQLQWAHRDHRTLLMEGWALLSSEQTSYFIHLFLLGTPAIRLSDVMTGSKRNHLFIHICLNSGHRQMCVFCSPPLENPKLHWENVSFQAVTATKTSTKISRFTLSVSCSPLQGEY